MFRDIASIVENHMEKKMEKINGHWAYIGEYTENYRYWGPRMISL